MVTPQIIDHYSARAISCKNPVLKARYAGLVWDFHTKVNGKKAPYKIGLLYINSLLDSVEGNYISGYAAVKKLKRALDLSCSLNNTELVERSKKTILSQAQILVDAFKWLTGNKSVTLSQTEEEQLVSDMEERLRSLLLVPDINKLNPHAAERVALPLAEYHFKKGSIQDVERIIVSIEEAYEKIRSRRSAMQMDHYLKGLYDIYTKFQLNGHAQELLIKIRALGPQKASEMGKIPFEASVPTELIAGLANILLTGNDGQPLEKIAEHFIPKRAQAIKELEDMTNISPLSQFFKTQLQDKLGRTITELDRVEEDPEGHIMHRMSQGLLISSIHLIPVIEIGIKNGKLSTESILSYLAKTPVVNLNRHELLQVALNAFFNNEYIVFLHLIIPQIEDTLRNTVENISGNVLKPVRSGGHQLRTLDDILRDATLKKLLGEDLSSYFRVLFTDQRGWNLRNNICHGLLDPEDFSQLTATWVLHALFCIGLIRPGNPSV